MATMTKRNNIPSDIKQDNGSILDLLLKYSTVCAEEFCGKCMPCRYGTKEWTFILQKIVNGEGTMDDLQQLKKINRSMKTSSLCKLGLTAPYYIDAVLKYQKQEIENFIISKKELPSNITQLPIFNINTQLCDGCPSQEKSFCKQSCTVNAITGEVGQDHTINLEKCYACDACISVCPQQAIAFS